jgi:hypothetical protein
VLWYLSPGNDDDQHRRPGSRFAFRTVRECISDSLSCRPKRDSATGESWIQKGPISLRPVFVTASLIFCGFFGDQIREVDEWEKDIKEGGKYFFTR